MSRIKRMALLLALLFAFQNQLLWADNPVIKFARGIENIVTSPTEYLTQGVHLVNEKRSHAVVIIATPIYGTFWTLCRIVGGAVETLTFFIAVPEDYKPLMNPSTPIEALRKQ